MDLLQYDFFRNALAGSFFICIACGIVGVYIVSRRLVFISGGITHASFGGLGLGFYLGVSPILSALVFAVASAFGVEWLSKRQGVREDSAIAVLWAMGMASGVIFLYLTPGFTPNITAYLFGNILTVTFADVLFAGVLAVLLTVAVVIFYPQVLYTAFDAVYARTRGICVSAVEHLMMLAVSVTVVLSIRLAGIMLLMSLLTVPQMTAALFVSRIGIMMVLSVIVSIAGCVSGLFFSYCLNIPSGAAIIFVQVFIFLVCKLVLAGLNRPKAGS
jgi:zinc transport system permease protein